MTVVPEAATSALNARGHEQMSLNTLAWERSHRSKRMLGLKDVQRLIRVLTRTSRLLQPNTVLPLVLDQLPGMNGLLHVATLRAVMFSCSRW